MLNIDECEIVKEELRIETNNKTIIWIDNDDISNVYEAGKKHVINLIDNTAIIFRS